MPRYAQLTRFPGGGGAIVCGPRPLGKAVGPCVHCGRPAGFLCDGPPRTPKAATCDRPLCQLCTSRVAPGRDLCRDCRAAREGRSDGTTSRED